MRYEREHGSTKGDGMSDDNAELLRRAWAAYDSGDFDAFAACLTADWREYDGQGDVGTVEDERRTMELHRVAFPDKHTEIHRMISSEDLVACHCTVTATHTGPYLGVKPTGKRVVIYEMMFNRVENGRLAETWAVTEGGGFYQQLTGQPAPDDLDNMG